MRKSLFLNWGKPLPLTYRGQVLRRPPWSRQPPCSGLASAHPPTPSRKDRKLKSHPFPYGRGNKFLKKMDFQGGKPPWTPTFDSLLWGRKLPRVGGYQRGRCVPVARVQRPVSPPGSVGAERSPLATSARRGSGDPLRHDLPPEDHAYPPALFSQESKAARRFSPAGSVKR